MNTKIKIAISVSVALVVAAIVCICLFFNTANNTKDVATSDTNSITTPIKNNQYNNTPTKNAAPLQNATSDIIYTNTIDSPDVPQNSAEVYKNKGAEKYINTTEDTAKYLAHCMDIVVKEGNDKAAAKKTELAQAQANGHASNVANSTTNGDLSYCLEPVDKDHQNNYTLHIANAGHIPTPSGYEYTDFDSANEVPWYVNRYKIWHVVIDEEIYLQSAKAWFGCIGIDGKMPGPGEIVKASNIKTFVGMKKINMTKCSDASFMFTGCNFGRTIGSIDNLPINMENVSNFTATFAVAQFEDNTFHEATGLFKSNTGNTNFNFCFSNSNLATANFPTDENKRISDGANFNYMFLNDKSLTSVSTLVEKPSLTPVVGMFKGCSNLKNIFAATDTDWSKQINNSEWMFDGCGNLPMYNKVCEYANNQGLDNLNATFAHNNSTKEAPPLFDKIKSLILKETIDGVEKDVQYFPVAGNSLSSNITFYKADGTKLPKTGPGGRYQQSDLTGATQYTGNGSFKTLRSVDSIWNNTFEIEGESSTTTYPALGTLKEDFIKANLVGGNEKIEQVYPSPITDWKEGMPINTSTCDGVNLTDIWNAHKGAGFGGLSGFFWSSYAYSSGSAHGWYSVENRWSLSARDNTYNNYVLVCRTFNPGLKSLTLTEKIGGVEKEVQYFPVASDFLSSDITFYKADGTELPKTGPGGRYQQSDLTGATQYTGYGSFKTLRSIKSIWNNIFEIKGEGPGTSYPVAGTVKGDFIKDNLVGGNEKTEQVYPSPITDWDLPLPISTPTYDGVNLSDIWNVHAGAGFGGPDGCFWSSYSGQSGYAWYWESEGNWWHDRQRTKDNDYYVLISRVFNPEFKPLILTETIGGVEKDVQYFPVAGDSLSSDITFYKADGTRLPKTGSGGRYQQSDLAGATQYTGYGSFKTLRSINSSWNDTFEINGESSETTYPALGTVKGNFIKANLVGGNEKTEQVYPCPASDWKEGVPTNTPTYDKVNLTDIWNAHAGSGFGGLLGFFWSSYAASLYEAYGWGSGDITWFNNFRVDLGNGYVLVCRSFNSSGPAPKFKSLTLTEKIGGVEKDVQYFPVAGDSLSSSITFYNAEGNELLRTGPGGRYQQSDLTGATQYTGDGPFKTLRSISSSWNDTFEIKGVSPETTYPTLGTVKGDFIKANLVGGNENTEQVYPCPVSDWKEGRPTNMPTYDKVNLTDIWNTHVGAGFGGLLGFFWSSYAASSYEAYGWTSSSGGWNDDLRSAAGNYVLVCRAFNSSSPVPKLKSLTLTEKIGGGEKNVQYFPVAGDSLSSDVTFYKADGTELPKTGPGSKYQQSDLTGATQYSGYGSFKALRSIDSLWNSTFEVIGESSTTTYPALGTVKADFVKANLVGGNEYTEQVYPCPASDWKEDEPTNTPKYDGVNLTDIWNAHVRAGFGGSSGFFWSSYAYSSGSAHG